VNDLLWLVFITVCAVTGIVLTVLWIRARKGSEEVDLDEIERALSSRGVPTRKAPTNRPPPPTPDLISIQESWGADDDDGYDTAYIDALGRQDGSTPTAPSGPRQGWQRPPPRAVADFSDPTLQLGRDAAAEAEDEATAMDGPALDPAELAAARAEHDGEDED